MVEADFTIEQERQYIVLSYKGEFIANCDNMQEAQEEMQKYAETHK